MQAIPAQHNRRPCLADFGPTRRIEIDPPDRSALDADRWPGTRRACHSPAPRARACGAQAVGDGRSFPLGHFSGETCILFHRQCRPVQPDRRRPALGAAPLRAFPSRRRSARQLDSLGLNSRTRSSGKRSRSCSVGMQVPSPGWMLLLILIATYPVAKRQATSGSVDAGVTRTCGPTGRRRCRQRAASPHPELRHLRRIEAQSQPRRGRHYQVSFLQLRIS